MTIIINSPQEFYLLLKGKQHIFDMSKDLIRFNDFMSLYDKGCNCNREDYLKRALDIYKKLNRIDVFVINEIKSLIPCQKIIFNLSGTYIFEV